MYAKFLKWPLQTKYLVWIFLSKDVMFSCVGKKIGGITYYIFANLQEWNWTLNTGIRKVDKISIELLSAPPFEEDVRSVDLFELNTN